MAANPKTKWLRSEPYLAWVRTQRCVARGTKPSIAHHLTGYCSRGSTKVHDFWTMPLHPDEHTESPECLHLGVDTWELKNGRQWKFVADTLCRAIELGSLEFANPDEFEVFRVKGFSHEEYCEHIVELIESGAITVNKKRCTGRENVF